ncbi:cirl/latrotoxin receptor [Anopheles darlingi]|uniref:Cirl/latrotoxin receptor n=1 Tax=Anopheles darlingi TaxID=43151 RepID=W5JNS0_ANODA|nr:cirl/latrotoxin receptor [Anopheles darlingi]
MQTSIGSSGRIKNGNTMEKVATAATSLGEVRRQRRGEGHQWRKRHEARRRATVGEVTSAADHEEKTMRIGDHCEPLRLQEEEKKQKEKEDSSSCRTPQRSERIPSIEEGESPIAIRWSNVGSSSSRIASIETDRSHVIGDGDRWWWWLGLWSRRGSLGEVNDTGTPPAHSCRRKETVSFRRSSYSHWTNANRWLTALLIATIVLLGPFGTVGAVAPKYETAYACEGKTLMIECENGDLINLIRANYGRFSITICNDHGNVDWSVNCMSPKSLRVLHSKCAQKQNCSVLASTTMFGDPCPGTHKYLEAHYQCVSAAQSSTTTNRPSPPWLKTSQPIVWSTSTVRNPVLSRLNITQHSPYDGAVTTPMVGVTVAAVSTSGVTARPPGIGGKLPGGQALLPRGGGGGGSDQQQHPASAGGGGGGTNGGQTTAFRNKGFENKSVNDDLAIIKTISDRKKAGAGPGVSTAPTGGGRRPGDPANDGEEDGDGGDLLPTQTAVLSGAPGPGGRKDVANTNVVSVGGGVIGPTGGGSIGGVNTQNNNPQGMAIDVSHACGPSTARNLFWNVTRVGEVNVQPCPGGATGIAKWRCVAVASLTPEQRVHLQQEHQQMLQLQGGATVTTPTVATLDAQTDSSNKGDISFSSSTGSSTGSSSNIHLTSSDKQSLTEAAAATWYAYQPDLTQCRSLWLNNLEVRVQQPESSLISIANDLAQVTSSKTLYGGDMLVATKIVQTMSQKMHYDIETIPDQRQREALVFELLNSVVKTGSNLLDQSQHASWLDLSVEDQMRVATSLLTGLEDNAFLLADTILREKHVVQKVKNILISIRVLETRNFVKSVEIFPDSSTERWQVSSDQIELPKAALIENSEGGLVRIVFVAFDRLEQILRPQFSNIQHSSQQQQQHSAQPGQGEPGSLQQLGASGVIASANIGLAEGGSLGSAAAGATRSDTMATSDPSGMAGSSSASHQQYQQSPRLRLLNSKVISASLGKGRHIQLSQPIRMVLKHLRTKNVSNPTCVFWNYIDHAWSEDGCHVEHTNQTHTVCMCNHLTNFALLVDAIDETQLSLLSIIDDDIKLLIYISVGILIVIGVIALFALKLFSGVFTKLRHGGEPDHHLPAGVGVRGVVDRDGGLSISGHHGIGTRMHHHHHHVGNNNAGVDLHHPNATAHHHHLVHHHLAGGGGTAIGHHLLVADDFQQQQQQQQQQPGVNNLHNHHPNNLGNSQHHHTMINNNNLVTTTFNNLNGGGGSGGSSCSPSPPGSGYEQHHLHPAHHPGSGTSQHLGRLNNNPLLSSNSTSSSNSSTTNLHHLQHPQLPAHHHPHHHHQQQQPPAAAAATFQQQQQHHQHHNQSQAAATAAGAILLQGLGGGGGSGSSGVRRPSSASSLIASTSLITQPLGADPEGDGVVVVVLIGRSTAASVAITAAMRPNWSVTI